MFLLFRIIQNLVSEGFHYELGSLLSFCALAVI